MDARIYRDTLVRGLEIRPLDDAELPAVLEIERTSYSHPWSEGVFRDCFKSNYRLWALVDGDSLAGYAVVSYQFDEAHLLNLCVAPGYQRRGAGRRLLRHLVARSARDGMTAVILEVRISNDSAIALYASEGFEPIGERPGYYPTAHGRENARVMALTLSGIYSDTLP